MVTKGDHMSHFDVESEITYQVKTLSSPYLHLLSFADVCLRSASCSLRACPDDAIPHSGRLAAHQRAIISSRATSLRRPAGGHQYLEDFAQRRVVRWLDTVFLAEVDVLVVHLIATDCLALLLLVRRLQPFGHHSTDADQFRYTHLLYDEITLE